MGPYYSRASALTETEGVTRRGGEVVQHVGALLLSPGPQEDSLCHLDFGRPASRTTPSMFWLCSVPYQLRGIMVLCSVNMTSAPSAPATKQETNNHSAFSALLMVPASLSYPAITVSDENVLPWEAYVSRSLT